MSNAQLLGTGQVAQKCGGEHQARVVARPRTRSDRRSIAAASRLMTIAFKLPNQILEYAKPLRPPR